MIKTLSLALVLSCSAYFCSGQIFGGTAPSVKWSQINTPQSRIIFPKGLDSVANKIAENIYFIAPATLPSIGAKTKKVNIVLRNLGLTSNGYVSLMPFRSELYLTPPQNAFELGSTPWPDLLSAHEYRHVQQYNNFDVGLSHLLKVIFGYGGQALGNEAAVPDWFFEGDAVYIETNVSHQGRGSLPYFFNGFRALARGGKNYSWMKLRNGSYLHYTPDKYTLGFMLTAYGRERYGLDIWKDIIHDAASFKPLIYPLQNALKKHTGQDFRSFRDSAFLFFGKRFGDTIPDFRHYPYWQNENCPVYDTAGNLIYLKSSVKDIPQFVILQKGKEKKIRTADYLPDNYFSYNQGKIVYASRRYHPRWTSQAYNEIRVLDVTTGLQKTITRKTRYLSPDIDVQKNRIIAVNPGVDGKVFLDLLNANTGEIIGRFAKDGIINFAYPKFMNDFIISCITNSEGKMTIGQTDISSGTTRYLLPFSDNVIGFPLIKNDTLYFSISQKLNDELFAYTFSDRKLWKISGKSLPLGKYHVAVRGDSMSWSTFTGEGIRLQFASRDSLSFQEIAFHNVGDTLQGGQGLTNAAKKMALITSSFGLSSLNNVNSNRLYRLKDTVFTHKKYSQLTRPFNFYSLEPDVSDPNYTFTLVGENVLNTVQTNVSISYNRADRSKQAGLGLSYGGLFPVLTIGYNYAFDRRFLSKNEFIYYNTSSPYIGFYIPMNLSSKRNFRSLSFGSTAGYNNLIIQRPFKNQFKNTSYTLITNYISFSNQSQTALAQVLPRYAQTFSSNYKFPVSGESGYQYQATGRLYLPGFSRTHSLNFTMGYSQRDTINQIGFSSGFPFSRGYEAINLHKMFTWQVNYQFPVLYPETGTLNLVYLLRLRANLFFDHTIVNSFAAGGQKWQGDFNSTGVELYFDTKWWNQTSVSFGFRYSRLLDEDIFGTGTKNRWEIILPVNLLNKR
jgi:hypothetical protein